MFVFLDSVKWSGCIRYSHCYIIVNYGEHWAQQKQTPCLCNFVHWNYSAGCVPFWWLINEDLYGFCRHRWFCQVAVSKVRLIFGTDFSRGAYDLHCQVIKVIRLCNASLTTLLCLGKCNTITGFVKTFIKTECSTRVCSPIPILSVTVANGSANWPFATCIRKVEGSSVLNILAVVCCLILSDSVWVFAQT